VTDDDGDPIRALVIAGLLIALLILAVSLVW